MFNLKSKKEVALEFASKQTFCPKMTESGRSMIEMLGVLAIVGVLSVGGIAGYTKAMLHYKVNKTIEQITHMAAAIKTAYMSQKDGVNEWGDSVGKYYSLDNATAIALGVAPDEIVDGNTLKNVFGGSVILTTIMANQEYQDSTGFSIIYNGIPKDACVALSTQNWTNIFQGIELGDYLNGYYIMLSDAIFCNPGDPYLYEVEQGHAMVTQACGVQSVTFSPADAALGCTCDGGLCSIAFVTDD